MKQENSSILYSFRNNELTCPICKSHNVTVKPDSLFIWWTCQNCKYISRNIIRID